VSRRDNYLMKEYGITEADFRLQLRAQEWRCALCGRRPTPPQVDHCHKCATGMRAILCRTCNMEVVGSLDKQGPAGYRRAINLLRRYLDHLEKQHGD
jgi:hypothetical protein